MHTEYLVYDDQDRRVIVSLGTRPKAWQRKIAARNHNVFLVQSFAIRLLRSGSHRAAGGCKSSGDGGTAKSGAARQPCHRHPITSFGKGRSEEHTSDLQSLMRSSYAVFCLKKKNTHTQQK